MVVRLLIICAALVACGGDDAAGRLADAPSSPATDAACVASGAEGCDGVDNDCDGFVDNVDTGGDGLFDCQRVLLLGAQGLRPASDFEAWAHGNGTQVTRVASPPVVDAALLAAYDIVLVDRVGRAFTADEASALATWVDHGGGVMALTGYSGGDPDKDMPNSLLAGLGVRFAGALRNGPVTTFAADPLTAGLTSITFSGGFGVEAEAGASAPVVVGRIADQPVAIAVHHGAGRVYLWGDEWVTFDSEWKGSAEVQRFWVNAFGWLGKFK